MDYSYLLDIELTCPQGAPQEISEIYDLINKEITLAKATNVDDTKSLHLSNAKMLVSGITVLTDKFDCIQRVKSIADKFQSSLKTEGDLAKVKDRLGVAINEAQAHCVDYERRLGNLEFQNRMYEHDNQKLKVRVKSLEDEVKGLRLENADNQEALQKMATKIDKLERYFDLSQEGFCIINSE